MLGKILSIQDDHKAAFIEFDASKLKMGDMVNIKKARSVRSLQQNRLYWAFISWCISPKGGDLQSQGHFSKDGLHEDIKQWFKSTHQHDFDIDEMLSTATLNTKEFTQYFEIVKFELMAGFFGIDVSKFDGYEPDHNYSVSQLLLPE
jgi:hypothetical protein